MPTETDRARFRDTERSQRRVRPWVAGSLIAAGVAVAPYAGTRVWILVVLGIACLCLTYVQVPAQAHAVRLLLVVVTSQLLMAVGVASTGGVHSPIMSLLLVAPAGLVPRFGSRTLAVALGICVAVTAGALLCWAGPTSAEPPAWLWPLGLVFAAAGLVASMVSSLSSEIHARERALIDPLTGVLSRESLHDGLTIDLEEARWRRSTACAMLVDIDQFKSINDGHGHAAGDLVLQQVALAIIRVTRGHDSKVFRLGGDEFLVVFPNLAAMEASDVSARLSAAVTDTGRHLGHSLAVSVGVAISDADGHLDRPDDLIARADAAMYRVKRGIDTE